MSDKPTLLARFLGRAPRRAPAAARSGSACPLCLDEHPAWPLGLDRDGGPQLCLSCGRTYSPGRGVVTIGEAPRLAAGAELPAEEELAASLLAELDALGARPLDPRLAAYLDEVARRVSGRWRIEPLRALDRGEPEVVTLPGGSAALSLGLLAALGDEAQIAFVLAREAALLAAGLPLRRFGGAWARRPRRLAPGRAATRRALSRALEVARRLGYGTEAETGADAEGLRRIAKAGYDPAAAPAALAALETASRPGQGGRFVASAVRRHALDAARLRTPAKPESTLNREVYRRAVGGFAVFGRLR
jgi:hypothetical protein